MGNSELSPKLIKIDVDYGYVVVHVPAVVYPIQVLEILHFVAVQDHLHRPLEYGPPQPPPPLLEHLVHICAVQLIPQSIRGQHQVLVGSGEGELGDDWFGRDVGPCEDFDLGEVVLLVLEVEVTEGAGGLQPVLEVACGPADEDVGLVGELPQQSGLLEGLACIETQVGHGCLVGGEQHALAVACVGYHQPVLEDDRSQGARPHRPVLLFLQVLLKNTEEAVFNVLVGLHQAPLHQLLHSQFQLLVFGEPVVEECVEMFGGILGLIR